MSGEPGSAGSLPPVHERVAFANVLSAMVGGPPKEVLVGRYRIERHLGAGAMGDVYEAFDPGLSRKVAVKFVRLLPGAQVSSTIDRLRREARALACLSHPNVVPVYDADTHGREVFLVMELVPGVTLRRWLRSQRSADAILDALVAAGEGLAAAHAAGIVHRDFKPDNVIVGDDGRVRVLDFGLAIGERVPLRSSASDQGAVASVEDSGQGAGQEDPFRLTRTGFVVGTPLYMAPEQHASERGDPRADVFAFGVVLYEGLAGRPPFSGRSPAELCAHKRVGPGLRPVEIPRSLWRVLERALDPDPARRFHDLGALLVTLRAARRGRSTSSRIAAGLGLLAVGGVAAALAIESPDCSEAASEGQAQLARRQQAVEDALHQSSLPYAVSIAPMLHAAVDADVSAWADAVVRTCRAAQAHRVGAPTLAARRRCLSRHHAALESLLGVIADHPDGEGLAGTIDAVASLERPEACEVLQAEEEEEVTAEHREAASAVREQVARALAIGSAGRHGEADALLQDAQSSAAPLHSDRLLAEVFAARGELEHTRANWEPAREALDRAWSLAMSAGGDRLALSVLITRLRVEGSQIDSADSARRWIAQAEAWDKRVGPEAATRAELALATALLSLSLGQPREAVERAKEAERIAADLPERLPVHDSIHNALGLALEGVGDGAGALQAFREALRAREARLGEGHPSVALAYNNVGWALFNQGRSAEAVEYLEEAVSRARAALGPDHPEVAGYLLNLGNSYGALGDMPAAIAHARESLRIRELRFGSEDPAVGRGLIDLASTIAMSGDAEGARPLFERASQILEAALGSDHPHYALTQSALGLLDMEAGDLERAVPRLERAVEIFDTAVRPEHRFAVEARVRLIEAVLARDDAARAGPLLARHRQILAQIEDPTPRDLSMRFELADVLWAHGRASEATEVVREMLPHYERAQAVQPDPATAWLAKHPIPGPSQP